MKKKKNIPDKPKKSEEKGNKVILKIGAYDWTLYEEVDKIPKDLGTCDYQNLKIKIVKDLLPDVKKCTILHELLHAMFVSSGYSPRDEENIVDILANQLLLFIKMNPDFFKKSIL